MKTGREEFLLELIWGYGIVFLICLVILLVEALILRAFPIPLDLLVGIILMCVLILGMALFAGVIIKLQRKPNHGMERRDD